MFSRDEQRKIHAKSLEQWQKEQRDILNANPSLVGWVIETARWPFPLTADDLAFLKINKIRA